MHDFKDKTKFDIATDRGYQNVVIYAFGAESQNETSRDKGMFTNYQDGFKLPTPRVVPI